MAGDDIVDRAIEMERLSRDHYRRCSKGVIGRYVGDALKQLAGEEQKHMDILKEYRASFEGGGKVELPDDVEYEQTWRGFTEALDHLREGILPHSEEITVIQRGIDLESQGLALYREARNASKTEGGRRVFAFLSEQEVRHRAYLEKLLKVLMALYEEPPETRPQL